MSADTCSLLQFNVHQPNNLTCVAGIINTINYTVLCCLFSHVIDFMTNYQIPSQTNALFINLVKSFKFTLKYTIISLLYVSVFNDHHQGALSVPN